MLLSVFPNGCQSSGQFWAAPLSIFMTKYVHTNKNINDLFPALPPKKTCPPSPPEKKEVGVHFVQIFFSFSNVCFLIAYFDIFIHLFFIGLVSWWLFCVFVFLMLFFVCVCVSIVCICGYILFCFFLLVLVFGL